MLKAMNHFDDRMIVAAWRGLVTDFARQHNCSVLVRGLRNAAELPYESAMAYMNNRLDSAIKTVFFLYDAKHVDISSSLVRDLVAHGRLPEGIVPDGVSAIMREIFKAKGQPLS